MGAFICRQPNGLLCRFSTVVDTITDYNLTEQQYIKMCAKGNIGEAGAIDIIKHHLQPFSEVKDHFINSNMTKKEFNEILKDMELYTLKFTKKELEKVINGIDSYSSSCDGVGDEEVSGEMHKCVDAFDKALRKIGIKRHFK